MNGKLPSRFSVFQGAALAVGVIGAVACVFGAMSDARQFFVSYLFAYVFWIGLALGCLCVAMIHHLTGGRWGDVTRRFQEAAFMTLPLMVLLFVPILFGLGHLYPWAQPSAVAADETLQKRAPYMNFAGFWGRAVVALIIWSVMALLLRRWSLEQNDTKDLAPTRRLRALSGPGVVIYPLTATFVFIDWVLSIEPRWYSTMFPVIICIGQILSAFAFSILMLGMFKDHASLGRVLTAEHFHHLGNLLLTFVLFWTYISFGQLLIIYSGNLPREIGWYLHRIGGDWKWLIGGIALFHFFLPFFLLLFRPMKRNPRPLIILAAIVFLSRIADVFWLVHPTFFQAGIRVHWLDLAAFAGVGGLWITVFLSALTRQPLLLRNDPRIEYELAHVH